MTLTRYVFLAGGVVSLVLGIIGLFVPLLPTTPFLLLAAWFFERGSEHFHGWLLRHPWFGPPILDWRENGAIRRKNKAIATLVLSASGAYLFSRENIPWGAKAGFALFAGLGLVFLWTRKSR